MLYIWSVTSWWSVGMTRIVSGHFGQGWPWTIPSWCFKRNTRMAWRTWAGRTCISGWINQMWTLSSSSMENVVPPSPSSSLARSHHNLARSVLERGERAQLPTQPLEIRNICLAHHLATQSRSDSFIMEFYKLLLRIEIPSRLNFSPPPSLSPLPFVALLCSWGEKAAKEEEAGEMNLTACDCQALLCVACAEEIC